MLANLAAYPKLVGGIGAASTDRAARFYASVLDAEVVAMSSSEAAEFSKLADTTYRDVNIALANEFARAADALGIDVTEVIAAANSQPYSHIHQPGIGVGGHCIPVYPHLLLSRAPGLRLVETAREVNDGQVGPGGRDARGRCWAAWPGRRCWCWGSRIARASRSWPTAARCRSSPRCGRPARTSRRTTR